MRRSTAAILLFALASACADSTTSPSAAPVSVAGTFNLVTVNGAPLPWTGTNDSQYRYEVIQDTYTLSEANTWTESFRYRFTDKVADTTAVNELTDSGNYVRSGSRIQLTSLYTNMSGSFDGSAMTFVLPNAIELVFRR